MLKRGRGIYEKRNRLAQTGIIVTVVLILIALVAVAIFSGFIKKQVSSATKNDIDSTSMTTSFQLREASYNGTLLTLKVNRPAGKGNLTAIKFTLANSSGYVYNWTNNTHLPNELETYTYTLDLNGKISEPNKITIVPFFQSQGQTQTNAGIKSEKTVVLQIIPCTSFTYSNWGDCNAYFIQTRTITASSPSGCSGGNSVLTQSCTFLPFNNNLVSYWSFNNDVGTSIKDIRGVNNGTNVGGVQSVTGKIGRGYYFNGTNGAGWTGYLNFPSSPSLEITDQITVSAWINKAQAGSTAGILVKLFNPTICTSPFFTYGLTIDWRVQSSTALRWVAEKDNSYYNGETYTSAGAVTPNIWAHIVSTFNGTTRKIYVNGNEVPLNGAVVTTGAMITNNNPVVIGVDCIGAGNYFNGTIDEVAVWNRSLSAIEIAQLYNYYS